METRPEQQEPAAEDQSPLLGRVLARPEGKVLAAGVAVLMAYFVLVGLAYLRSAALGRNLLSMTFQHIIGGRAAGMSLGYALGFNAWLVIAANMTIETFMVLLFYPLFVLSYHHLIVIPPLEDTMRRARRAAQAHEGTIMKFGVPGLLLFVWFPFWMTGPLVGSVIGFLIGLRTWVNMLVVLAGTCLAILCWGVVFRHLHERLEALGPYVPFAFVAFVLLLAIAIHVRYYVVTRQEEPPGQ